MSRHRVTTVLLHLHFLWLSVVQALVSIEEQTGPVAQAHEERLESNRFQLHGVGGVTKKSRVSMRAPLHAWTE